MSWFGADKVRDAGYKSGGSVDNAKFPYIDPTVRDKKVSVVYSVGVTEDGRISLSVGDGYYSSLLTMNSTAAKNMIRMLEAAIESFSEEETEGDE